MRQNIRIGTIAGVEVGVNWSVLVIFALVTWDLAYVFHNGSGTVGAADWAGAVVAALAFFASLLAHEASHAVVARRNGVGVHSITLWLFGGVAQLESEASSAGADFRIAAVGPGTSLALAALFGIATVAARSAGAHGLPVAVLTWLAWINLVLAAFNLLPAAPLDGGRILRAGLWRAWGDPGRAGVTAARAGRVLGIVLVGGGAVAFLSGWGLYGLWPALLGWFLYTAAGQEERASRVRTGVGSLAVWQVMTPHPPAVPAQTTVAELADGPLSQYRGEAVALTDSRGWLAGVVTLSALRAVPLEQAAATPLSAVSVPLSAVPVVGVGEPVATAAARMAAAGGAPAYVLDAQHRLAGIVTVADLRRAISTGAGRTTMVDVSGR